MRTIGFQKQVGKNYKNQECAVLQSRFDIYNEGSGAKNLYITLARILNHGNDEFRIFEAPFVRGAKYERPN